MELVAPVVGTVAGALFFATPPPKVSTDKSAFVRVICPCTPPAMLPFIRPSSVNAAQITEACLGADGADIVKILAGIMRLEITPRRDADALVGRRIIMRGDRQHPASIRRRNAEAQA